MTPHGGPANARSGTPPLAEAYAVSDPGARVVKGQVLVPISFLMNGLGTSVGSLPDGTVHVSFFAHSVDFQVDKQQANFDNRPAQLAAAPQLINGTLYVPLMELADFFDLRWSVVTPSGYSSPADGLLDDAAAAAIAANPRQTTFLLQFQAAYIENVDSSFNDDKLRIVVTLSNPTRIIAVEEGLDAEFQMAAAKRSGIADVLPVNDEVVPRVVTRSGDWKASTIVRMNYAAPVQWYTLGAPDRVVINVSRMFEQSDTDSIEGGLTLTRIHRGTDHGPLQMYVVRINPNSGWRVRVAPCGYSVMQRGRPSHIAGDRGAVIAVNGGFFSYDGAAVGALMVNGEWLRLPWKSRTAIGFRHDGLARIGSLRAVARATFDSGWQFPIRDLNGWPANDQVTALTHRFGDSYPLHANEMAVVVKHGKVISTPGGGTVTIPPNGFVLIGSGASRPWLNRVHRGQNASLDIEAPGWSGFNSALGGGPRLLADGQVQVTALEEEFKSDVRDGRGPRTAIGIDGDGHYIILVVDGRQNNYSTGLTLTELAYTMQQLGAVEALNLDGGGSTTIAVRGHVINRPSDGAERSVSNVLLVMR